jgi:hypothetical protein
MKKMANFYCALALFALSTSAYAANPGEGKWVADEVFRASNSSASTGLVHMNSAYTIRDGEMSINLGFASETDSGSGTDYIHVPLAITYGITDKTEFGLTAKYINASAGPSGMAGGEAKMKWRFRNQSEYLPAMSLAFSLMFPAGDAALNEVNSWGARLNFLMASEAQITDNSYIGMYVDVGATSINDSATGPDDYLNADFGLLFPISDDKRLQLMLEFNSISGRTNTYLGTGDYNAITPGLRYASEGFKLTLGAQSRDVNGTKLIGTIGWEF